MPELPEVETMRRGLLPIVGRQIDHVEFPQIPYRPIAIYPSQTELQSRCNGRKIQGVDRVAKRVIVRLDSGDSIVMQPKMAGIAMLSEPPTEMHTRVVFHLAGRQEVDRFLYWDRRGLGTVCLWNKADIEEHLGPKQLGPDAVTVSEKDFIARYDRCHKQVKDALLDQKLICGIGNLYAAEILHAARIHPKMRCDEIPRTRWRRIHRETVRILNEAIEKEGSTLRDGTYRNAINGEGTYQMKHLVYDREDEFCLSCHRGRIQRIVQTQRSTFFCPRCQR